MLVDTHLWEIAPAVAQTCNPDEPYRTFADRNIQVNRPFCRHWLSIQSRYSNKPEEDATYKAASYNGSLEQLTVCNTLLINYLLIKRLLIKRLSVGQLAMVKERHLETVFPK
ncbi:MAG: hypothetical protein AAFN38_05705 [Cyanobacteria bacterium J06560_5]